MDLIYANNNDFRLFDDATTVTDWTDVSGLSLGTLDASTDYLIICGITLQPDYWDDTDGRVYIHMRLTDDGTTGYLPQDPAYGAPMFYAADHGGVTFHQMFKYNEATPAGDLKLQYKTENGISTDSMHAYNAELYAIPLASIGTEGVDWIYDENRTLVADDSTTVRSEVTFTPSAEDWLFIGFTLGGDSFFYGGGHGGIMFKDQVAVGDASYVNHYMGGSFNSSRTTANRANWCLPTMIMHSETLSAVEQDWGMGSVNTTGGNHIFSSFFGLRLGATLNHFVDQAATVVQNGADVWNDNSYVTTTHTTDVSADKTLLLASFVGASSQEAIDIDDGAGVSYLAEQVTDTGAQAITWPEYSTPMGPPSSVDPYYFVSSVIDPVTSQSIRKRTRVLSDLLTTGGQSFAVIDIGTATDAGGAGGGGGGGTGNMMMLGIG